MPRRALCLLLLTSSCSPAPAPGSAQGRAPVAAADRAPAPPAPRNGAPPLAATATSAAGAQADGAAPAVAVPGDASPAAPAPAVASAPAEAPLPPVKLSTIGMHVGGGPFDEATKEPFKRAVEPRFPELARCWKHVAPPRELDVGVDLVIEAAGGRPRVSNPRTTAAGAEFIPCVVAFFESVEFDRPKNGKTALSYSVRWKP